MILSLRPPPAPVPAPPAPGGPPGPTAELAAARILVVDDDPRALQELGRLLAGAGYARVELAANPFGAVRLGEALQPDLVLVGLHLAGADGIALMCRLRSLLPDGERVPFLVLSGRAAPDERARALAAGAKDFLDRPFQPAEALLRIRNLLEARHMDRALRRRNDRLEERVRERTATLRAQEELYRALVENASDLIFRTDAHGCFTYVSPSVREVLGYHPEELVGTRWWELVRPDLRAGLAEHYLRQKEGAPAAYREFAVVTRSGEERWVGQRAQAVHREGAFAGMQAVAHDVTERRRMERLKDELVSVVSHELRTPLTSIRAALGLLAGGLLESRPERARQTLELALRNSDRLVRLINDVLDLERMQSGRCTVEPRPYAAAELMEQAAEVVRPQAEAAGVWIVLNDGGLEVVADPDRVLQVLVNLLSNAVKFSPAGGTVWMEAAAAEGTATLSVRDQGRGIPEGMHEEVFERFRQVDSSDARERGGSGLGLAICRGIVEQHGGRIWVESEAGRGSAFRFTLPLPA